MKFKEKRRNKDVGELTYFERMVGFHDEIDEHLILYFFPTIPEIDEMEQANKHHQGYT